MTDKEFKKRLTWKIPRSYLKFLKREWKRLDDDIFPFVYKEKKYAFWKNGLYTCENENLKFLKKMTE